jgi:GWxTD domain-containing protein
MYFYDWQNYKNFLLLVCKIVSFEKIFVTLPFVKDNKTLEYKMKRIICLLLSLFPVMILAQNINAVYSLRTYHASEMNYAEINTTIDASTLKTTLNSSNKYVKQAELTTYISSIHRTDSAIYVDKRIIATPQVKDSNELTNISIMDMQRVKLSLDTFLVIFELRDASTNNQPISYNDVLIMSYSDSEVSLSDIMIVDKYNKTQKQNIYSKGGYDLYPYMFDAISKDKNLINYYVEIYNADKVFGKGNPYIISTIVENTSTSTKVDNVQTIKRQLAESVTSLFGAIDISSLLEGSYYLTVEVRDKDNMLHAYKRYPFFKQSDKKVEISNAELPQNAFVNNIPDSSLKETILSLRPIASTSQIDYIQKNLKTSTKEQDRYFIYQFFSDINSLDPQKAWEDYSKSVTFVNNKYSTPIKKGYTTDMGRVYLVYGAPDEVIDEKFASSMGINNVDKFEQRMNPDLSTDDTKGVTYYPYQIWIYNQTPFGESNRKFIFYAKQDNLAEYFLLHSNAAGEKQELYWENTLSHGSLDYGVRGKAGKQFETGHK